jgi:predicted nucleic-acid-binding Zn-ribbon protein
LFYFNPENYKEEEWKLPMKCANSNEDADAHQKVLKNLESFFKIAMNNFISSKKLCSRCYVDHHGSFLDSWYKF